MIKSWGKTGERKPVTVLESCSVFSGGKVILDMYFLQVIFNNKTLKVYSCKNIISDPFWARWSWEKGLT